MDFPLSRHTAVPSIPRKAQRLKSTKGKGKIFFSGIPEIQGDVRIYFGKGGFLMTDAIKMELPPISSIPLILRREVEARYFQSLISPLCHAFGEEEVRKVITRSIAEEARKQGEALRRNAESNGCETFKKVVEGWNRGDSLRYHIEADSPERFAFRVSRCAFAEMYRHLGLAEWGFVLSCQRDFSFLQGFNPEARLFRPHTLMEGHGFCDFDYRFPPIMKEEDAK